MISKITLLCFSVLAVPNYEDRVSSFIIPDIVSQIVNETTQNIPLTRIVEPVLSGIRNTASQELNAITKSLNGPIISNRFNNIIKLFYPTETLSFLSSPEIGNYRFNKDGIQKIDLDMNQVVSDAITLGIPISIKTLVGGLNSILPNTLGQNIRQLPIQNIFPTLLERIESGIFNPINLYTSGDANVHKYIHSATEEQIPRSLNNAHRTVLSGNQMVNYELKPYYNPHTTTAECIISKTDEIIIENNTTPERTVYNSYPVDIDYSDITRPNEVETTTSQYTQTTRKDLTDTTYHPTTSTIHTTSTHPVTTEATFTTANETKPVFINTTNLGSNDEAVPHVTENTQSLSNNESESTTNAESRQLQGAIPSLLPYVDIPIIGSQFLDHVSQIPLQIINIPANILNGETLGNLSNRTLGLATSVNRMSGEDAALPGNLLNGVLNVGNRLSQLPQTLLRVAPLFPLDN